MAKRKPKSKRPQPQHNKTLGLLDGSRISDYKGDCIIREPWGNESTLTIPLPTLLEAWLHGV
jgi:hypothetical protein